MHTKVVTDLRKILFVLSSILLLSLCVKPSYAHSVIVPIAVLEDAEGQLTLDNILTPDYQDKFSALKNSFVGGYSRKVFWFKAKVTPVNGKVWLEFKPPYLDSIEVFWQNASGEYQKALLGDLLPFTSRPVSHRHFILPIEHQESFDLYVRLQTHSSSILSIRAWEPETFQHFELKEYFIFALVIGGLISLLIFNLRQAVWRHDATYRSFLIYLAILILALMSINGFIAQFFLAESPELGSKLTSVASALLFLSIVWVYQHFLDIRSSNRIRFSILLVSYAFGIVLLTGGILDFYVDVASYFGLIVILIYLFWLFESIRQKLHKQFDSVWLILASASGLIGSVAMILVLLGFFSLETIGLYAFQLGSVISVISFQMAISGQVNRKLKLQQQQEMENKINLELLEKEKAVRNIQDQFLSMITHEFRTPLSVISLVVEDLEMKPKAHQKIKRSIKDINNIIDRCAVVQKIEHPDFIFKKKQIDMTHEIKQRIEQSFDPDKIEFIAEDVPKLINTDAEMLQVILNNLIDNAIKYSTNETKSTIELRNNPGKTHLIVEIRNQEGLAGHPEPDKVFDKYYRSSKAYAKTGSGLGLYIVQQLVHQLGAQIQYQYEDGVIVFRLVWPYSIITEKAK